MKGIINGTIAILSAISFSAYSEGYVFMSAVAKSVTEYDDMYSRVDAYPGNSCVNIDCQSSIADCSDVLVVRDDVVSNMISDNLESNLVLSVEIDNGTRACIIEGVSVHD
jgi:hypothetical protein